MSTYALTCEIAICLVYGTKSASSVDAILRCHALSWFMSQLKFCQLSLPFKGKNTHIFATRVAIVRIRCGICTWTCATISCSSIALFAELCGQFRQLKHFRVFGSNLPQRHMFHNSMRYYSSWRRRHYSMLALMQHTIVVSDNITSCKWQKNRLAALPQVPQFRGDVRRLMQPPEQQVGDVVGHYK